MKALNILKNLTKEDITFKKICEINEAIEELEDFKNRKCSNCLSKKHCDVVTQDEDNFYCSDWEQK